VKSDPFAISCVAMASVLPIEYKESSEQRISSPATPKGPRSRSCRGLAGCRRSRFSTVQAPQKPSTPLPLSPPLIPLGEIRGARLRRRHIIGLSFPDEKQGQCYSPIAQQGLKACKESCGARFSFDSMISTDVGDSEDEADTTASSRSSVLRLRSRVLATSKEQPAETVEAEWLLPSGRLFRLTSCSHLPSPAKGVAPRICAMSDLDINPHCFSVSLGGSAQSSALGNARSRAASAAAAISLRR
jgi:hypothetical protein